MKILKKIAFVLEEFAEPSPGQQLLDRFLIGYPRDGEFHRLSDCEIIAATPLKGANDPLKKRVRDFHLDLRSTMEDAVADADGVIVACAGVGAVANEEMIESVLKSLKKNTRCFVHGTLANSLDRGKRLGSLAASREAALCAGGSISVTYRLPEIDLPLHSPVQEALIVVQGAEGEAELQSLDGLLPLLARRAHGEAGIRRIRLLKKEALWTSRDNGAWSRHLLAAAISRSNTVQGDPVKDGRTQDIVGLGLVERLSKERRGWLLEHADGVRSTILVLDGAVADFNFAVRMADRTIISAQLYRPPSPMQDQFSRLAAVVEEFFITGRTPWPVERSFLTAGLMEAFRNPEARNGEAFATPELMFRHR